MRITEKLVNSPEEEGVTLEYIRLTKDFEEIKEYVQHKGDTLTGYRQTKEKVSFRIEDVLYFETVDGLVFAYTVDCVYEIKRLFACAHTMAHILMHRFISSKAEKRLIP